MFQKLSRSASNPHDAAMAQELARIAGNLHRRGLAFVRKADLGESSLSAKAAGERTLDEAAVLYLNAVLYGLGTGGWLAVQTEADSAAGVILPALLLAGAAAGGVALADSGDPLPYGVPQSVVSGMYIGLEQGLVWSLWNQASVDRADEWEGKTIATVIWGSATLGAVAGGVIGGVSGTTPGRASFVGSASLWGGGLAGLTVAALSPDDNQLDDRALLGAAIGLNAAAIGGALAAGPVSPSVARVRFLDLGGIAGGLLMGGLYISAADEETDARALSGTLALGIGVGLTAAWFATTGMEPDRGVDESEGPAKSDLSLSPTLIPTQGGAMLGLAGRL